MLWIIVIYICFIYALLSKKKFCLEPRNHVGRDVCIDSLIFIYTAIAQAFPGL